MGDEESKRLARRAGSSRAFAVVFGAIGSIFAIGGAVVLGLSLLLFSGGWVTAGSIIGGGTLGLGGFGLWLSSRSRRKAARLRHSAMDARLMTTVQQERAGMTVAQAAKAMHMPGPAADKALTELAKQGQIEMDVDSEGVIRYRVEARQQDEVLVEGRDHVGQHEDLDQ